MTTPTRARSTLLLDYVIAVVAIAVMVAALVAVLSLTLLAWRTRPPMPVVPAPCSGDNNDPYMSTWRGS
jgi:hypothetical protein